MDEKVVHKVSFQKSPIWFKGNFIGKYDGINYRFTFSEYTNDEADDVIRTFSFKWPGRIPENKEFAEEGIKQLFLKRREDNTLDYNVDLEIDAEAIMLEEEEKLDEYVLNIEMHGDENNETTDDLQKGFEGED